MIKRLKHRNCLSIRFVHRLNIIKSELKFFSSSFSSKKNEPKRSVNIDIRTKPTNQLAINRLLT